MNSRKALALIIGIILIVSGLIYRFGLPAYLPAEDIPDEFWGILLLVGGGMIALLAGLNEATAFVEKFIPAGRKLFARELPPYDINSPANSEHRRIMIANVREGWVRSRLNDKAAEEMRLELGLQDLPQYLMQVKRRVFNIHARDQAKTSTKEIADTFDASGQKLLILGAPGAGKSFLLAELASVLLSKAEANDPSLQKPLPIWVDLASWRDEDPRPQKRRRKGPRDTWGFEDWLAETIHNYYSLSTRVTHAWLEADQICLLLDGLDEVALDQQAACVDAINRFLHEFNAPMVVCCRSQDYAGIAALLNLNRALELQPLDDDAVAVFLGSSKRLDQLKKYVLNDRELLDQCATPLFLDILSRSFFEENIGILKRKRHKERLRNLIFDQYIKQMFSRRPLSGADYSAQQAVSWLRYLASQLQHRSRTSFYIEDLQFDWIDRKHRVFTQLVVGLVHGLVFGLVVGLVVGLVHGLVFGLASGLVGGLIIGLFGGLISELNKINVVDDLRLVFSIRKLFDGLFIGLLIGLVIGLAFGLVVGLVGGLIYGLVDGLVLGLVFGLVGGLVVGLVLGLVIGLVGGLVIGLNTMLLSLDSQRRNAPNQGMRNTFLSVWKYLLIYLFPMVPVIFTLIFLPNEITSPISFARELAWFPLVVPFIVIPFLDAALAVIRHYSLRLVMARKSYVPWNLPEFLVAMKDRILLRQTGGGFQFYHRMLRDHLADMTEDEFIALLKELEPV